MAAPALAGEKGLSAHLGGAGSADTDGAGHASFKIDQAKNQVCYDLMVEKIDPKRYKWFVEETRRQVERQASVYRQLAGISLPAPAPAVGPVSAPDMEEAVR